MPTVFKKEARTLPDRASVRMRAGHPARPLRDMPTPSAVVLAAIGALLPMQACGFGSEPSALREAAVQLVSSPPGEGSEGPSLSPSEDGVLLSWLEPAPGPEVRRLRMSRYRNDRWSPPVTVAGGDRLLANWADVPSVREVGGVLVAQWLERGPGRGQGYGVRVARSTDGGGTWSDPWTPHEDATPTEHGFVSIVALPGSGTGLAWLDGRAYAGGADEAGTTGETALRFRTIEADGAHGPETVLDPRVCDCCQTDAAVTARGPVLVFRDRSADEVRDIGVLRLVGGRWTEGVVHEDGWRIEGCPVNGPAVAAHGEVVAVTWFTAAGGRPRVEIAFSGDAGATFGAPIDVDDGDPVGRVDVALLDDASAVVSWLERSPGGTGEVRIRRVGSDGGSTASAHVALASAERTSGFPRMAPLGTGEVLLAWTGGEDRGGVRVARVGVPAW